MASHHVVGRRWIAKVVTIDPAAVQFMAVKAPVYADCQGCIFRDQPAEVCEKATQIARERGEQHCEDAMPSGHSAVYALKSTDPRQPDLF